MEEKQELFCIDCSAWVKKCNHTMLSDLKHAYGRIDFYMRRVKELEQTLGLNNTESFSEYAKRLEDNYY